MSVNLIQPSFSSGEISPNLYARVDLATYHKALALCRNFFVDYRSGISTRTGTAYITRCKRSDLPVRLIPFTFSVIQTYVLEFGNQYMRVYMNGGAVLEPNFNITAANNAAPLQLTVAGNNFAVGDTVFITGVGGMVQLNGLFFLVNSVAGAVITLTDLDGNVVSSSTFGVYTGGGTIGRQFTLPTPYLASDLALLKFAQSADTMTLTHPSYGVVDLTRTQHYAWTISPVVFASSIQPPNAAPTLTASSAGSAIYYYGVTAVNANGEESQLSQIGILTAAVNIASTAGSITIQWPAVAGAVSYNVYKSGPNLTTSGGGDVGGPSGSVAGLGMGFIGTTQGLQFIDSNITAALSIQPPLHLNPFAPSAITGAINITGGSGGGPTTTVTVTDPTGSGFVGSPIVINGALAGVIVLNGGQNYSSPVFVFANIAGASATPTVGPSTGVNPATVSFFQQRKVYAAANNTPASFNMGQPGAFKNFDASNPVQPSDAITGTLVSTQVNVIKHMIAMPGGLVTFTGNGAWQITGGGSANAPIGITPANAEAIPQAFIGCSDVPPLVVNYDILFVQARGAAVRDLSYNFYVNIYTGVDISIESNHLLFGFTIREWCYAQEPFKIVWAIRSDGALLSLTFMKEQEIKGWAQHYTNGLFQSIATIPEGSEDAVYVIVKRLVNGKFLQYVERFASRLMPYGVEDAWSLDSAAITVGSAPSANLTPASASGSGVLFTADQPVFSAGNLGQVIRAGGGIATITAVNPPFQVTATITQPITSVFQEDPSNTPIPQAPGTWTLWAPITQVSGLQYLAGKTVGILADGNVLPQQVVPLNGTLSLGLPANTMVTKVLVGLPFSKKAQTLYLDTGEPTSQGKRKKIPAATMRLKDTRGLKAGTTFQTLVAIKERGPSVFMGVSIPLVTGDERINLDPNWTTQGQVCMQIDDPLPGTILGIIPEVVVGDTGK